jgi:hypothetical protein
MQYFKRFKELCAKVPPDYAAFPPPALLEPATLGQSIAFGEMKAYEHPAIEIHIKVTNNKPLSAATKKAIKELVMKTMLPVITMKQVK